MHDYLKTSRSTLQTVMSVFVLVGVLWLLPMSMSSQGPETPPPEGFVPDASTAIRIAEAVMIPIFGQREVETDRPFTATLEKDVWIVESNHNLSNLTEKGGVFVAKIMKKDGRILLVGFYK